MKRKHLLLIFALALSLLPRAAQAQTSGRDYFVESSNNEATSTNDKIHFKLLIYAKGTDNEGWVAGAHGSYSQNAYLAATRYSGYDPDHTKILYYNALDNRNEIGYVSNTPHDQAVAYLQVLVGKVVVTNTYEGSPLTFFPSDTLQEVLLHREQVDGDLAYLEFDWFPPASYPDTTLYSFLSAYFCKIFTNYTSHHQFNFDAFFYRTDQRPQLMDPFFYPIHTNGDSICGRIGVPYVCYQDLYQYHTSWNNTNILSSKRSDILKITGTDSVQRNFSLVMQTKNSHSTTDSVIKQWLSSDPVDIPAYHKIHDFSVEIHTWQNEQTGTWYKNARQNRLSWKIYMPSEQDIMPNDFFEVQRAYDSNFTNAQTFATIPIVWSNNHNLIDTTYSLVDSNVVGDNTPFNSVRVYYRVRRASSAVWGWTGHDYAAQGSALLANELSSIALSYVSRDDDFDNTHKINIGITFFTYLLGFGAADHPYEATPYWDPNATLYIKKVLVETGDTILVIRVPGNRIVDAIDTLLTTSSNGNLHLDFTDVLNTPCTHVQYFYYVDTTGAFLRQHHYSYSPSGDITHPHNISFQNESDDVYFTDAGNLNTLTATHGEYPDHVLITWSPTEGGVDHYTVETRPDSTYSWALLGNTTSAYWNDVLADPSISSEWHYRVTMSYTCNGNTVTDSRETTGSRSPWGQVSGRVHYEDGSGCPGITVVATRTSDGATIQTAITDESGSYLLDSLPYSGNMEYTITPTSQTAQFHYNNTSSGFATVNLSLARCITTGIDFDNISSVRLTGRVLYENSSIPVRDANFLLNGNLIRLAGSAVKTDASGNFELRVPEGSAFTLQVVKAGHHFANDGIIRLNGDSLLTLNEALYDVRLWDQTKIRLAGRVAGGLDQRNLPLGFGLSNNNLGDNISLVFELAGDNVSHIVRIPSDLTKDTLEFTVPHLVYGDNATDTVGVTQVHYQQKRIIVEPDPETGEFCVDIFPVRYKLIQATATGYATLFNDGRISETLDLGNAASQHDTVYYNSQCTMHNAQYKLTYRSPISITCKQLVYGREVPYFGEQYMQRTNIRNERIQVPLAYTDANGDYQYLFGAPVFKSGDYSFHVTAHEDYYYNNDLGSVRHDQVNIKGGTLKVYNGMHDAQNTQVLTMALDSLGQADFTVPIDYVSFVGNDSNVQRVLDLSVECEGEYVVSQAVRGYVTGHRIVGNEPITSTHGTVKLLDVLRDPPGSTSSAWLEAGSEYSYSFSSAFDFKFGLEIGAAIGSSMNMTIGTFAGVGGGVFAGQEMTFGQTYQFTIPIVSQVHQDESSSYIFRTNERISTSSDPHWVGQPADVYIGLVQNVYARRADAVQPIDSLTYSTLGARTATGLMATVAEGVGPDSTHYYLVIGKETELTPAIQSTFVYTHEYIKSTLIPRLIQERDALLLTCDSATAQSIANARHEVVYQSLVPVGDTHWANDNYYRLVFPNGFSGQFANSVDAYNRKIADWINVLLRNEMEKVSAIHYQGHDSVATYSLSPGTSVSASNNYQYSDVTHSSMSYPGSDIFSLAEGTYNRIGELYGNLIASMIKEAISSQDDDDDDDDDDSNPVEVFEESPGLKINWTFKPILNIDFNRDPADNTIHQRTVGYTLSPDELSNMDVSIYRIINSKDAFNSGSHGARVHLASGTAYNEEDNLYGSLVFFLRGGATKCPCELADSTEYYRPKMPISAGSLRLENPRVDIDVHERSDVPADRPAVFTLRLYNESEQTVGTGSWPISFQLKMNDQSNPHGARIYIDGMPLTDGRTITLTGNQVITKTMEVYAGDGYDFEDLIIEFGSTCISTYKSQAQFSVHYMPVSCDVNLTLPHDNWVMNTHSPRDSIGYYRPVAISDFDVNYRGFDHIELQYKLSVQSDDGWVTLCSYYADSALYAAASVTKAMIEGGRIENIRFYGERDPMEKRYDLRAVSFCRHGSGFISKASALRTGTKDTRCPRVFGEPEPANGILGVGDHLKLRFNEAIAGNYLDADNNFQLLGVTNRSGIASSTSVYFDGTPSCGASSAVTRVLSGKSFSIDLMAKPTSPTITGEQELFGHTPSSGGIGFGLEPAGSGLRLYGYINDYRVHSRPLEPLTDFTRLIMTYDHETGRIRFYAGTQEVTDESFAPDIEGTEYDGNAPLVFGHGYHGNMLEARLWFKPLSTDEIVETHEKRLTGYERKLAAYYPMNEGRGDICYDKASGSTLTLQDAAWTTPSGYSLNMNGQQSVTLAQDVLSRSNIQDYTLMFWFRTDELNQGLFSAGWMNDTNWYSGPKGTLVEMENGKLIFHNGNMVQRSSNSYADGLWHHYVLTVNRTFNNASIFVDGQMTNTFAADSLSGLSGVMMLGGDQYGQTATFRGHFDDFVIFEQALPRSLVETYDNLTPEGDEMGLVALLPFSEQKENSYGDLEEVFTINNQRVFTDEEGAVVEKVQPLIISPDSLTLAGMGDLNDHAPVRERDMLKKMNFDWSFNNDELLINLNMPDREINKNNIYITVRDVEDLNGNRTVNPSTWQVFVNKNVLLWNSDGINEIFYEQASHEREIPVQIMNVSGRRHQFTIDGMPDWLNVNQAYGNLNPQETQTLVFTVDEDLAVGVYSEIIYLTDEDDLSEPLKVMIEVRAVCPWDNITPQNFDRQMSLLGQVMVDGVLDTDPNDVVVAIANGQYVGFQHISYDNEVYPGYLFMTIYGNQNTDSIANTNDQSLQFRLWQASTGRIFGLSTSQPITFVSNAMVGLPPANPIILSTSTNEVQNLDLEEGWNWISFNLAPNNNGALDGLFFTTTPFDNTDQIKSVATQKFAEWNENNWAGSLTNVDYHQMYMFYGNHQHNGTRVAGCRLTNNEERTISLHGGWNGFPYLLTSISGITNAMADYIENVSVGDILKSQTQFAVFNADGHWMGSLTALVPGEGYLLYRHRTDTVPFTFRNISRAKGENGIRDEKPMLNKDVVRPATNMTIIASIENEELRMRAKEGAVLKAYTGNKLTGVAQWVEVDGEMLFFLTVGTDKPGQLSFFIEEEGVKTELFANIPLQAAANSHFGTLNNPVPLTLESNLLTSNFQAYPTVFTDHVDFEVTNLPSENVRIIIRNAAGETVDEINSLRWTNCDKLSAGVYFATLYAEDYTATVKLVKVRR